MKTFIRIKPSFIFLILLFAFLFPAVVFSQAPAPKKNGKYVEKYSRKHKKITGRYKNYLKDGTWLYYSYNGDTTGIENFSKGVPDGKYFHKTFNTFVSGNFKLGKKNGQWKYHRSYPEMDSICNYTSEDTLTLDFTVIKKKDYTVTVSGKMMSGKLEGPFYVARGNMDKTGKEVKLMEGNYADGLKEGKWMVWDKNQKPASEREFKRDTLVSGSYTDYYKETIDKRTDSILVGSNPLLYAVKRTTWFFNGQKMDERFYLKRSRDSIWTTWYSSGKIKSQRKYKSDRIIGTETEWFEDGNIKSQCNFVEGKREGIAISRNQDGTIADSGMYVKNKKDGKWIETESKYKKDRLKYERNYKEGKLSGKEISYYTLPLNTDKSLGAPKPKDARKKRTECTYVDNKREGKYTEWYPSGKTKIICNYKNGDYFGKYTEFDEKGNMVYMKDYKETVIYSDAEGDGEVAPPVMEEVREKPVNDYYESHQVEKMAEFPGGMEALYSYLQKTIQYPQMEKENNIQGKVYVSFIINADGTIEKVEVMKGIPGGPGMEKEAVRAIKSMPSWLPAKLKGVPVRQRYVLPVAFKLN